MVDFKLVTAGRNHIIIVPKIVLKVLFLKKKKILGAIGIKVKQKFGSKQVVKCQISTVREKTLEITTFESFALMKG